jgi:hypothetical protein
VDAEHPRLSAERLRVSGRTTEYFRPIRRQLLEMPRITGVRERMIQDRIVQAALVVRCR